MQQWTHGSLAHDLASDLSAATRQTGWLTWENIEIPDCYCRPDVFAVNATLNTKKWNPTTYEVKCSRADFLADIRSGKWRKYIPFSAFIVYATIPGVIGDDELPDGCGLIVRTDDCWERRRRGRKNRNWKLTERQWMNLCLKARNPSPYENIRQRGFEGSGDLQP